MTVPTGLAALGPRILGQAKFEEVQRTTIPKGLSVLGPRMINRPIEVVPEHAGGPPPPLPAPATGQWPVEQLTKLVVEQPERIPEFLAAEQARPMARSSALKILRSALVRHPERADYGELMELVDQLAESAP